MGEEEEDDGEGEEEGEEEESCHECCWVDLVKGLVRVEKVVNGGKFTYRLLAVGGLGGVGRGCFRHFTSS